MLLLSCTGLTRGFKEGPLFEGLGFELYHGDRVGLVGPNGAGKTTLLRILANLDEPDQGEVRPHAGARVALLQQQADYVPGRSLLDEARAALGELTAAQAELVTVTEQLGLASDDATRRRLAARYERLNELLQHHDAYNVDHHVEAILYGLGFTAEELDRPVESFSGGQQSRLMLAKLLLSAPDVMLLDEPSNHLDLAGTQWLENYLGQQREAMLIVSHDRAFLDRVVTKVFELHAGKLSTYVGNYQAYARQCEERYQLQLQTWQAQQALIAKNEDYVRRVNYGTLHKQAQSRQRMLDKLERVERPTRIEGPAMHFQPVRRSGDVVIDAERLAKRYDRPLFQDLSFQLRRGQRLGIMGPNGSGKTTLLRILLGSELPDAGTVKRGHQVDVGYFDQHLAMLPDDQQAIRAAWPANDPDMTEQAMRNLLARFGLTGDQAYQRVGSLSGGERSRVALARLVAANVNLLVLDEPTNHLDIWACEALEEALKAFEGTVIVVSHDRYFLNRVVDALIVLDGQGGTQVVAGNYETYELLTRARERADGPSPSRTRNEAEAPARAGAAASRDQRTKRKRRFPYRKVEDLESAIAEAETEVARLEAQLAAPDLYREGARVKETMQAFEDAKAALARLYEHWEEAIELNQ